MENLNENLENKDEKKEENNFKKTIDTIFSKSNITFIIWFLANLQHSHLFIPHSRDCRFAPALAPCL